MKFETILYDVQDEVLTITLNRPERLNAWTRQMLQDLLAAFDVADADDGIGAIVLTGAGRAFCAGADVSGGAETFNASAKSDQVASDSTTRVPRDGLYSALGVV